MFRIIRKPSIARSNIAKKSEILCQYTFDN